MCISYCVSRNRPAFLEFSRTYTVYAFTGFNFINIEPSCPIHSFNRSFSPLSSKLIELVNLGDSIVIWVCWKLVKRCIAVWCRSWWSIKNKSTVQSDIIKSHVALTYSIWWHSIECKVPSRCCEIFSWFHAMHVPKYKARNAYLILSMCRYPKKSELT